MANTSPQSQSETKRKVLISVLGHVDHGKSSILDKIRGTTVVEREAGLITQAIGASIIPLKTVQRVCGGLTKKAGLNITIPGFLAIDTPGHAAFTNLRKRGGSIADIAILVIDINEGIKPQTEEAIEILKSHQVPFVIAANKIDLISGWQTHPNKTVLESIKLQPERVKKEIEEKMYKLVGQLFDQHQFNADRFDRLEDYTKKVAIIPTSAKTGAGIPELFMVLVGLAQRFLAEKLIIHPDQPAKGTILEVKEEKGLGKTINTIIYDGTLHVGDTVVIGSLQEPIVTKIKALFEPAPLSEIREKKSNFIPLKQVTAATGVKIATTDKHDFIAGMPLVSVPEEKEEQIEAAREKVKVSVQEVLIETEGSGVVVKADSLGSLEALVSLLKDKAITIKKASIGEINQKDLVDAEANLKSNPLQAIILGFNIQPHQSKKVKIIINDVIYKIIEDYEKWVEEEKKALEKKKLEKLVKPAKIEIMPGYVFRQNNPAVVGVDILEGEIKVDLPLMNEQGKEMSRIKSIQREQESLTKAKKGIQVAIALPGLTVGRQIREGQILYSSTPEEDFRKLKELKKYLTKDEIKILKEIAEIKRKDNSVWGV